MTAVAATVALAGVAVACGEEGAGPAATTTTSTSPPTTEPLAPEAWAAVELVDLPDGLEPRLAEEQRGERQISYNDAPGDRYNASVTVAASDPAVLPFDQIVEQLVALGRPVVEVEVRGHRALIGPLTDDGREYGYSVMWDERPDLRITIADGRQTERGEPAATPESVQELASHLRGLAEADWAARVVGLAVDTHVGRVDPASEAVEVGRGEVDGDDWVLSAYVPPGYPLGDFDQRLTCLELTYRGESSGVQCDDAIATWSVLGGEDLVFSEVPGDAEEVTLEPSDDRDLFDPLTVATTDALERVDRRFFVAEMPYGACATHVVLDPGGEAIRFAAPPPGSAAIAACR